MTCAPTVPSSVAQPPVRRLDRALLRPWVLLLLRTQPAHGYAVAQRLVELGLPRPDGPSLYRLLKDLEKDGLLHSKAAPPSGGPQRQVYRVTAKGTRQLRRDAEAIKTLASDLRCFAREYEALRRQLDRARR